MINLTKYGLIVGRSLAVAGIALIGSLNLTAQEAEIKRPKIASTDIYERSDILVARNHHTLIPKGCALYVPDVHKSKFKDKAAGSFERLSVFYKANYSWLVTFEVTLDQAMGKAPIDETKLESLKRTGKVVIAVYQKNPISVKKYTPPTEKE